MSPVLAWEETMPLLHDGGRRACRLPDLYGHPPVAKRRVLAGDDLDVSRGGNVNRPGVARGGFATLRAGR